jgi:hypothetical protein
MKRTRTLLLAAASASLMMAPTVHAQGVNQRQAQLSARIDAGVQNRSLTAAEAARLRAESDDLARLEARYRASGGLSAAERADLDRRFDRLSRQIRANRHDDQRARDPRLAQREHDLETRIQAGIRGGGLTAQEADRARDELRQISQEGDRLRRSGRGLTAAERATLERRYDALQRQIQRNRADDDRRWTNLDQRQAAFEQRLNQAVHDRRLTAREADRLRQEFRTIARLERQYRRSRPGITAAERADLNLRFDRMESNFRANMTPTDNLFDLLLGLTR